MVAVLPAAFADQAEKRSARSVKRVRAAIALLQSRDEPVSLRRITAAAKELEPTAPQLTESVIMRNPGCSKLYDQARTTPPRRVRRPRLRDRRLERMTKAALIELVHALRKQKNHLELCLRQSVFQAEGDPSASD